MANWKKTIMAAAGGGGGPYWILEYGTGYVNADANGNEGVGRAALDSDDNIYITGWTRDNNPNDYMHATLNKVDTEGTFQLSYNYGDNFAPIGKEINVDSSGNIAIGCDYFRTGDPGIMYTNSSGTVQWARQNFMGNGDCVSCRFDSSGNVFVAGSTSEMTGGSNYYLKLNSSGSVSNQLWLNMTSSSEDVRGIALDSSGNMVAVGYYYGTYYVPFLLKTSSSLGVTFLKEVSLSNNFGWYVSVATDSSDNIYAAGQQRVGDTGNYQMVLSKFNSSGTHQWTKTLNGTSFSIYNWGVTVDENDDIFTVGTRGSNQVVIAKYNSSGALQFQNRLNNSTSGGDEASGGVLIDSKGDMIISGYGPTGLGSNDCWLAKLPSDGSKLGTYGNWTYQAESLTQGTLTPTVSNKSYTTSSVAYLEAETLNRYTTSYTTNLEDV